MIRVRIPGLGLDLTVMATTNLATWHRGTVNTGSRNVEIAGGERIPASAVRRIRYSGHGTWLPVREAREVVLLLAAIGGMGNKELLEMAKIGTEPEVLPLPRRPRGRPRKTFSLTDPWEEEPVGLTPAVPQGRLIGHRSMGTCHQLALEDDPEGMLVGE